MRHKRPRKLTDKQARDNLELRYIGLFPLHAIPGAFALCHDVTVSEQFVGAICVGNRYGDIYQEFMNESQ